MSEFTFSNNGAYFFSFRKRRYYSHRPTDDHPLYQYADGSKNSNSLKNLNKGFASKGLSDATRRKIAVRVRVLAHASELKHVKDSKGIPVTSRCQFITLTLPSEQRHTDQQITKELLGRFLDLCRKNKLLLNYVWRAEKQRNGNIHYHIITDSYAPASTIYRFWLMSCEHLGYVSAYRDKFKNLSLEQYKRLPFNANVSDAVASKRFWKGNRNNWQKPPCFDLVNCSDLTAIAKYISKYISKDAEHSSLHVSGRCWGCSQSVTAGTELFKNDQDFNEFGFQMCSAVLKRPLYVSDFFTMVLEKIEHFFVWFHKETAYFLQELRSIIVPCQYHTRGLRPLFS